MWLGRCAVKQDCCGKQARTAPASACWLPPSPGSLSALVGRWPGRVRQQTLLYQPRPPTARSRGLPQVSRCHLQRRCRPRLRELQPQQLQRTCSSTSGSLATVLTETARPHTKLSGVISNQKEQPTSSLANPTAGRVGKVLTVLVAKYETQFPTVTDMQGKRTYTSSTRVTG